jgi:hypothetical protein
MNEDMVTLEFPVSDPSTLPTTAELPLGDILLEIRKVEVTKTKENENGEINPRTGRLKVGGKVMVAVQFALSEPEELAGMPHTKRFLIGSDVDPLAKERSTWARNGTLLMKMFKKARVGGHSFSEYVSAAVGQKVGATVKVEKGSAGYADSNTPKDFFEPGEKVVRVLGGDEAFASAPHRNGHAGRPAFGNDD